MKDENWEEEMVLRNKGLKRFRYALCLAGKIFLSRGAFADETPPDPAEAAKKGALEQRVHDISSEANKLLTDAKQAAFEAETARYKKILFLPPSGRGPV